MSSWTQRNSRKFPNQQTTLVFLFLHCTPSCPFRFNMNTTPWSPDNITRRESNDFGFWHLRSLVWRAEDHLDALMADDNEAAYAMQPRLFEGREWDYEQEENDLWEEEEAYQGAAITTGSDLAPREGGEGPGKREQVSAETGGPGQQPIASDNNA